MEERTYCVYQIYNKMENISYIGSTCHFDKRIKEHKKGKHEWQIDFATHPEKWEVHILQDNIDEDKIGSYEKYFIDLYDSINNGYNMRRQGNFSTLDVREKISESNKIAMTGKIFSDEHKKNLSLANKGKRKGMKLSEETRRKMADARKKYWANKKTCQVT